jgi:hypothetical protein
MVVAGAFTFSGTPGRHFFFPILASVFAFAFFVRK